MTPEEKMEREIAEAEKWQCCCHPTDAIRERYRADAAERERDELQRRVSEEIGKRVGFEYRANEKYALRRDVEILLGVEPGPAGDEQMDRGFEAVKALVSRQRRAEAALTVAVREVSETARTLGKAQAETDTLKRRVAEWARNAALLETEATELRSILGEKNS